MSVCLSFCLSMCVAVGCRDFVVVVVAATIRAHANICASKMCVCVQKFFNPAVMCMLVLASTTFGSEPKKEAATVAAFAGSAKI